MYDLSPVIDENHEGHYHPLPPQNYYIEMSPNLTTIDIYKPHGDHELV
jgi:hypothetical protein